MLSRPQSEETEERGSGVLEKEVSFTSGGLTLRGTLALPKGIPPCASVLLLGGSGRVDRDENTRFFPLRLMADLARYLAKAGVASLRYDKRGVGASEGDYWTAGFYDLVVDARAAVSFLATHPEAGPSSVFVLGHSEGAYVAVRLGARVAGVAGVVLLAGGARLVEEELRWQGRRVSETLTGLSAWLNRLPGAGLLERQDRQIQEVKRSTRDSFRRFLVSKVNAKWARELLAYDPAEDLQALRVPVLALTGMKDIQVDVENLDRMRKLVTAPLETHALPDVTHLFREESGAPGLAGYRKQLKSPIAPEVPRIVVDWLKRHRVEPSIEMAVEC